MAFGKNNNTQGRFTVEDVRVDISGKRTLQAELDRGDADGLTLRHILNTGKHDWLLVVWENNQAG